VKPSLLKKRHTSVTNNRSLTGIPKGQTLGVRVRLWLERSGDGYRLRDAATEEVVRDDDERIRIVKVAGVSFRNDELQDDAFAPGKRLALVAEPDNEHDPHAIAVWDLDRRQQAGYVPAEIAHELHAEEWQAVALYEFLEGGRRVGLRVLLAPRDAWIGTPRA
jgi:HIRAN domain-containing protein